VCRCRLSFYYRYLPYLIHEYNKSAVCNEIRALSMSFQKKKTRDLNRPYTMLELSIFWDNEYHDKSSIRTTDASACQNQFSSNTRVIVKIVYVHATYYIIVLSIIGIRTKCSSYNRRHDDITDYG